MNEIELDKLHKFEDLQKASFILRKALKDIRSITNGSSCLDVSSSSSNSSSMSEEACLAFDNLTYSSSVESLNQNKLNAEWKKTTLKSIKRKDKLKKVPVQAETSLAHAKSMPSLDTKLISNNQYEKQLRKLFRNKSLNRSIRRAKSVYYRNRRSKSLEDLTVEEKINFLTNSNSSYLRLNSAKRSRSRSIDSCSSNTSTGLASDISSSYFHELSDWSPDFSSSDSDSSEEGLLSDWQDNLSTLAFSELNSSDSETDSELDDDERIFKTKDCTPHQSSNEQGLKEMLTNRLDNDSKTIEGMLSEVMSRMLTIHPRLQKCQSVKCTTNLTNDLIKNFQIKEDYLHNSQSNCFICMSSFEIDDEAARLTLCDHVYHRICIQLWLTKSSVCPMCTCSNGLLERSNSFISNQRFIKRETLL